MTLRGMQSKAGVDLMGVAFACRRTLWGVPSADINLD
jgi:hypothetical protein